MTPCTTSSGGWLFTGGRCGGSTRLPAHILGAAPSHRQRNGRTRRKPPTEKTLCRSGEVVRNLESLETLYTGPEEGVKIQEGREPSLPQSFLIPRNTDQPGLNDVTHETILDAVREAFLSVANLPLNHRDSARSAFDVRSHLSPKPLSAYSSRHIDNQPRSVESWTRIPELP